MSEYYDPIEQMAKIMGGASFLYKRLDGKKLLELRKSQDKFLDQLLIDTDPMLNQREAHKIMVMKNE